MTVDPSELQKLSVAVLAALRRDGRIPTRLDEEDYEDIIQEGIVAALVAYPNFDPKRGSLGSYLAKPITRAQVRASWKIAHCGITGDVKSVQVWSIDEFAQDDNAEEVKVLIPEALSVPDVAEEIEAFDHIWHTRYGKH